MNAAWRRQNLGYLLFAANDRCLRDKLDILHHGGFGAISDAQLSLFHHLDIDGTRLTTIAARAGLTKQSMIELVNKAEALGYVEREPDPDDKRAKIVRFTPSGAILLAKLLEAVAEAEARVAAVVGADFLRELKQLLGDYSALPVPGESDGQDSSGIRAQSGWHGENIGRVFAFSARRFARDALGVVHEQGYHEVTEVLLALFRNLDLTGTRLTDLATRAHMTKQSMRELVDRAQTLGFVERRPDPEDGRAKTIMFTPSGLAMLDEMRRGIAEADAHFIKIAGAAFAERLKTGLIDYVAEQRTPT